MLTYEQNHRPFGTKPTTIAQPMQTTKSTNNFSAPQHRHLWVVTGPAGCGKTTIAEYLAEQLQLPYIEGDKYHPEANIKKMATGIPLTDADRWDWLIALRREALQQLNTTGAPGVVLTCSALKEKYRDEIRMASLKDHGVVVHFIYLRADEATLLARVGARQGHYMGANMVHSQFLALEEPTADEPDVLMVDVSGSLAEVQQLALAAVTQVMSEEPSR